MESEIMLDSYFSKRHSLRPESFGFVHEYVPESARTGLYRISERYFEMGAIGVNQLYSNICYALCLVPQKTGHGRAPDSPRDIRQAINDLFLACDWFQFYDICEIIPRSLNPGFLELSAEYYEKVNELFKKEKLDFIITGKGIVEKTETSFTDNTIKKARYLLRNTEFEEANEHFEEAVKLLNTQIDPDVPGCMKHVALAIESAARKVNNNPDFDMIGFEEVIADMTEKEIIIAPFNYVALCVYGVTGGRKDSTYSSGGCEIGFEEAEFVLASAAAVIVYLAGKRVNITYPVQPDSNNVLSPV
jgi:tetratricopeptide (TPR) repeat protein